MRTIREITIIGTATALFAGSAARAVASNGGQYDGSDLVVWGFIGFCALIIVGQLLPALISFMAAKKVAEQRLRDALAAKGEEQPVHAVIDESE
jgi:hypothetical protein